MVTCYRSFVKNYLGLFPRLWRINVHETETRKKNYVQFMIASFSAGEHLRQFRCSGAEDGGGHLCQRALREKSHRNCSGRGRDSQFRTTRFGLYQSGLEVFFHVIIVHYVGQIIQIHSSATYQFKWLGKGVDNSFSCNCYQRSTLKTSAFHHGLYNLKNARLNSCYTGRRAGDCSTRLEASCSRTH